MLVGLSLGALDTLFVADLERRKPTLGITRYLAINPPVNLLHGMEKLDEFTSLSASPQSVGFGAT